LSVLSIEQVDSIAEVDASEWDRLAGRHVLASHAWLRTHEECAAHPVRCRYVLARDSAGLLAAAAGWVQEKTDGVIDLDHVLYGRGAKLAQRLGLSALPALVCGTRMGAAGPLLVRDDVPASERARLMDALAEAVERIARENGWNVCFREVACVNLPAMEALGCRGYLNSREMPTACLDIHWSSFAEFRRELRRQHPATAKNMSREISRGRRNGVVIEQIEDPGRYGDRLHALMNSHYLRLNGIPFPYGPRFFEQLKSSLGARAVISVARIEDEVIGVLVGLRDDREIHLPMIGIDLERSRAGSVYFNLGYNRPIQDSIAAGDRKVYFGKLLYRLKARRGCTALYGNLYLRVWNRRQAALLRPLFAYRSRKIDALSAAIPREEPPAATPPAPGRRGLAG